MLLQYRGKSFFPSKLIRWWSWGVYSHSSWSFCEVENGELVGDTSEFEAWHKGGVRHLPRIGFDHTKGTVIDLYQLVNPLTSEEANTGLKFLLEQIGKKYDFNGIIGFLLRSKENDPNKWFCSELVFAFLNKCNRFLLKDVKPFQVTPQMLPMSPEFKHIGYIIAGGDLKIKHGYSIES